MCCLILENWYKCVGDFQLKKYPIPAGRYANVFRAVLAGGGTVVLNLEIGIIYFLEFPCLNLPGDRLQKSISYQPQSLATDFVEFRRLSRA